MNPVNWHSCFFLLFALVACASAVAVVVTGNIVRMACFLVVSLAAVAGLFFLAGADFLGAVQLMVYVGGTMVLLVFGVMLTAHGPFVSLKTGGGQWIMAVIIGGSLLAVLLQAAFSVPAWMVAKRPSENKLDLVVGTSPSPPAPLPTNLRSVLGEGSCCQTATVAPTATRLGLGLLGVRVDQFDRPSPVLNVGRDRGWRLSGHLLAFEIISMHLVVVLVGAAYLARARRRV